MTIPRVIKRAACFAVSVVALSVAITSLPVYTPKAGAMNWAESLNEAERLTYGEPARLASLPEEYRLALLAGMERPEHQAALWRGLFRHYRDTHQLTSRQSDALLRAELLATPEVFTGRRSPTQDRAIEDARLAIREALGASAAMYLYKFQGPVAKGEGLPLGERLLYLVRTQVLGVALAQITWNCDCEDDSECSYEQTCWVKQCYPRSSWWGCGPDHYCTTKCAYFRPD